MITKITKEQAIKAYKVFNSDFTCRGFKFEVGQSYKQGGAISLCNNGFHACIKLVDCFNYYSFDPSNKVCEVLLWGDVDSDDIDKICANNIEIVKEISWFDVLSLVNTGTGNTGLNNSGDRNSGDRNSGNWNSGYWNSGYWNSGNRNSGSLNSGSLNSGDWNSGSLNSGDWNSGNRNSGFFNDDTPTHVLVFGADCDIKVWQSAYKPGWLYFDLVERVSWEEMTEQEKQAHPEYEAAGGYLKTLDYKEAFLKSFMGASKEDRAKVRDLPNFDETKFYNISGIRLIDYGI